MTLVYNMLSKKFHEDPSRNPHTGRKIKIGGVTYKKLVKEFGNPTCKNLVNGAESPTKKVVSSPNNVDNKTPVVVPTTSSNLSVEKVYFLANIDPFCFESRKKEFELFSKHFSGAELYFRLPQWILYREDWISTSGKEGYQVSLEALDKEVERHRDPKKYLSTLTDVCNPAETLCYWYLHYNPEKANRREIDRILVRFAGREDLLYNRLYRKYVDPKWVDKMPLF